MKYSVLIFASFLAIMATSCKKNDILKGEEITVKNVSLSMKTTNGLVRVPEEDSGYSKTAEYVTIPIEVLFSDAVPQRFNAGIVVNEDTVKNLIAAGKLPNTILLPSEYYTITNNIDVLFGADHSDFNLVVDVTAIERNYGKNLAMAIELSTATKNNAIEVSKKTAIIVINTAKVIKPEEIHYISFTKGGNVLDIPESGVIYPQDATTLTVPVSISLAGEAAGMFNVKLSDDQDTLQYLITNHTLPADVVVLKAGQDYTLPDSLDFPAFKSQASFNINVKVDVLKNNFDKKVVLALAMSNPTSHLLDSVKNTVVLALDPSKLVESDVTNNGSVLTVQYENTHADDQGENSTHLVDNNTGTKFLIFDFHAPAWMQLQFPQPQYTGAYTMTSANDAPGRDPKDWQLLGSNDGSNWTVLDVQTNQSFANRFQTNKYTFSNKVAYTYYRLNITAIADPGGGLYQQAEWRLIQRP